MSTLRRRLAEFGFESNDDFDFVLRCLFEAPTAGLRLLNPVGDSGRRKTAFAHALGHALDYPHVLYLDFSRPPPPPVVHTLDPDAAADPTPAEAPPSPFERAIIEACAYSEAARTVLILDQLQDCDFADQVRLCQFIASSEWAGGKARAHPRNLLLIVIAETPLYHSLARLALRVWTDARAAVFDGRPQDHGWPSTAEPLFEALGRLCSALGQAPTASETRLLLADLADRVRTVDHLRAVLYGRIENLDRDRLYDPPLAVLLEEVVQRTAEVLGVDEIVLATPVTDADAWH